MAAPKEHEITDDLWVESVINQQIQHNDSPIPALFKQDNLVDIDKISKKQIKMHDIYIVEGYMCLHTTYYKIYIPQAIIDLILFMFAKSVIQIKITDNIKDISHYLINSAEFIKTLMTEQESINFFKLPFELDLFINVDIKTLYNDHTDEYSDYLSGPCSVSYANDPNMIADHDTIKFPQTLPAERHAIILSKCGCNDSDIDCDTDDINDEHYKIYIWEQDEYCTLDKLSRKVMKRIIVPNNNIYSPTTDQLSKQLLVFMFYVHQKGEKIEMECYMMLNEEIKRFCGDDIINKLPQYFEMNETNFEFIEEQKKEGRIQYLFDDAMKQFDAFKGKQQDNGNDIECKRKTVVIHYGNTTIEQRIDTNEYIKAKIQSKEQIPIQQEPCIVNGMKSDDRIIFEYDSNF